MNKKEMRELQRKLKEIKVPLEVIIEGHEITRECSRMHPRHFMPFTI
jgi:hypothetical protein